MGALEIVLLAAGAVIFIASFCIPVKQEKLKEETKNLAVREVKDLVSEELENVRGRLSELSEEKMQQQIEKSERSMERISNEKIMAVNEYSDTVLEEIHKNHEEVVFLYDMLKGKKESLSESFEKAEKNIQELLQQVKDSEVTVREILREIAEGQKELEGRKAEAAVRTAPRRKKPAAVSLEKDSAGKPAAAEAVQAENAVLSGISGQKEEGVSAFSPFVPEKIEVVPKKKASNKTAETDDKAEIAPEKKAGRKPVAKKAPKADAGEKKTKPVSAVENVDVMQLLSDSMEIKQENSNGRILELHRAGKSNMSIARELGLGVGEVKLVIDLYEGPQ